MRAIRPDEVMGSTSLQRHQVEHVFRNLIGNAIDHNPMAGLTIKIGRRTAIGAEAYFVEDNGAGIQPNLVPEIFVPFRRGQEGDSDGMGLGLAIVEGIVTNAGGRIWCESHCGKGTTFWFTLPHKND